MTDRTILHRGYSLIETLVMLAVISLLTTAVLQTVRMSSESGLRISSASLSAMHEQLDITSVRHAVEATRSGYRDDGVTFTGTRTGFSGITHASPFSDQNHSVSYFVDLAQDGSVLRLVYVDSNTEWSVSRWNARSGRIEYWDHLNAVDWVETWPPELPQRTHYAPLPRAIRLVLDTDPDVTHIVFRINTTAIPPARASDIVGVVAR